MFVRRVETRAKGAARGVSYRLVHSRRIGPRQVRQIVLAYFPAGLEERVPKPHWKLLAAAIKQRLSGQTALLELDASDPAQRALAERIDAEAERAAPLVRRRLLKADFDVGFHVADDPRPAARRELPLAVLPSTLRHTDVREVGGARLLDRQARALGLRECLAACGLRPRHVRLGLAQILARALHPGSERETLRWLRADSALGEVLGLQPGDLAKDALYAAADALWERHARIENTLFAREQALFGPVLIDPPTGEAALRLWDAVTSWLEFPHLYEMQRPKAPRDERIIAETFRPYLEARDWVSINRGKILEFNES